MQLRALSLRAKTEKGTYGTYIEFKPGLVVLRAGNSTGKSTCVQSVIYALGLEGMLSAAHSVPLPHVMTSHLEDESGIEIPVLESDVMLEIDNGRGEVLTLQRTVKGQRDRRLVSTWNGPALTQKGGHFQQQDFYVRMPGAASEDAGLHTMLTRFLGWTLPTVVKFDGTECPLYLECIFPLSVVEQKRGWSGIQAQMPKHYGIRDVSKRAIEFAAGLQAHRTAVLRGQLHESALRLRSEWKGVIGELEGLAESINGRVQGLSDEPTLLWPPPTKPHISLLHEHKQVNLDEVLKVLRRSLRDLEGTQVPLVSESARKAQAELSDAEESLASLELSLREKLDEHELEKGELEALGRRLRVVREDYRRNQDAVRLRSLGSLSKLSISDSKCPTCAQAISEDLLSLQPTRPVMSLEENMAFLKSQLDTFQAMMEGLEASLKTRALERASLAEAADNLRARIRTLRETLVSDGRSYSLDAVQQRVAMGERVRTLSRLSEQVARHVRTLEAISGNAKDTQAQIALLPKGDLSADDEAKLKHLESDFIARLERFGVRSVPPRSIRLSRENYNPNYEGFDINFDLSASDMIRMIWAYLGMLLSSSTHSTASHPGFLLFDEPRQQETERVSFAELIKISAQARTSGHQVILATSEEPDQIRKLLLELDCTYMEFTGKMLRKIT